MQRVRKGIFWNCMYYSVIWDLAKHLITKETSGQVCGTMGTKNSKIRMTTKSVTLDVACRASCWQISVSESELITGSNLTMKTEICSKFEGQHFWLGFHDGLINTYKLLV